MREVESFEGILSAMQEPESMVAICEPGAGTTYINGVLDKGIMAQLKEIVADTVVAERDIKKFKLEEILGLVSSATEPVSNPIDTKTITPEPVPEPIPQRNATESITVELVKEYYHDKDMTIDETAKALGVNRSTLYTFITQNGLRKPGKKEQELFRDTKVQTAKKEIKKLPR